MIKINLAQKKRSAGIGLEEGGGLKAQWHDFLRKTKLDRFLPQDSPAYKSTKGAQLRGKEATRNLVVSLILGMAVFGMGYYLIEERKLEELGVVNSEIERLANEMSLLDSEIAKTAGYETLRKSIEADEKSVKTKMSVVQKLLEERPVVSKMLIALSQATPKDVWISGFTWQDGVIKMSGSAIGASVVSDFQNALEETIYFKDVNMMGMRTTKDKGVDVTTFDLEAKKR